MKPIRYTDCSERFKHVDLAHTNLAVTFARLKREQDAERLRTAAEAAVKVTPIKRKAQS